ncbi:IQ motif, EF-hand binding site [Phytophthora cinnamomi]|uniref:IQ motif, EF-hand binding site n=1 Tax=Phytophthora cinnamomi TaxID=4785 RepID=UPI00355A5349|nr:IQ motif, EF-hand binding site [Phytophthora cinnamomi]
MHGLSPRQHGSPDLTEISKIPREFFVVETNSVLLPQNYPPNQYKSILNAQGQWETIVFPALTPNNRQQVLYLRQTLDKMRATMPQFEEKCERGGPETETDTSVLAERRRLMVEYTGQETQIYSYCFHELARQIKCICKEQSELLYEIRERYDGAVTRLINQLKVMDEKNNQQQDQMADLSEKYERALEENKLLQQKVDELGRQMKAGPPVAAAQEAFRSRKTKERRQRSDEGDLAFDDNFEKSDEDDSEIDDEEAEWRRQRDTSSVSRHSLSSKHDSTKELHLAATRLQVAFQKYQARKEQTRITIRVEKQAAAMDIQRSYRGFRDRQLALHRRAIMRTILRRREENAAVELMQANVRAYLLNRRRSAKLKLSTLKLDSDSELTLPAPVPIDDNTLAPVVIPPVAAESIDHANKDAERNEPTEESNPNPRQTLIRLLTTFRELASVISLFQRGEARSLKDEDDGTASEGATAAADDSVLPPRPASTAPSEIFDDEDVVLFQQTMQEAQALVGSLHVVLGTVPEETPVGDDEELTPDDCSADLNSEDATQMDMFGDLDQHTQDGKDDIDTAEQTDIEARSDVDTFVDYDDNSISIPFGERDAMRLQNYAELHLDDSLWSSATYYPASREDMAETESLLALALASREQRKRLVSLKQFISDIYDTIVGKLKELPPRRLADIIVSRCHLTLSFIEWRQQRSQLFSRAVAADQPGEQAMPVKFSIDQVTREHFRCRLGLPQLIDAAVASLHESINDFAEIDADVKRFQEFMASERSEEELVFCCVCRYLCANRLSTDDSPAGTASSSYHRQPMFHPVTMREVIDVPHALELANLLFRVEDENSIIESDTPFTEVENVVYRQYLPTNGYHQFEAIVSSYFVDPDSQAAAVSSINEADNEEQPDSYLQASSCRRPSGSPRRASAMVRPTNFNQFHSKQYNSQAPRSPVIRHQQQKSMQLWSPTSATADEPKWVYFEEVLALLIKYRGEMNHFHLFSYWVQELFGLAASSPADDSSSPTIRGRDKPSSQVRLLDDTSFVETLTPLSLGPTERELKNIFHNSLRQRKLQVFMPLRVFTSVALLLLRNGLLSVSTYAPMQKPGTRNGISTATRQRSLSIREENEDKEWRSLALKWRTQESAFEAAIEAIYHEPSPVYTTSSQSDQQVDSDGDKAPMEKTRAAHALQLLQLRQELYDLFASRSGRGRDLKRAHEIYEILVNERLARVGGDTQMLDAHLESSPLGSWSTNSFPYF